MGQHNLAADKREPYETDIRVPFFIKGPGVAEGLALPHVTGMVDIRDANSGGPGGPPGPLGLAVP
jgi:hypothetical protein